MDFDYIGDCYTITNDAGSVNVYPRSGGFLVEAVKGEELVRKLTSSVEGMNTILSILKITL